ncbi:ImmA/IrrE family metallo-endopeptidase [Treponema zioleckii]|uniref:ImmA/IrrE family metallo-endopeptidase n=1 Tax=Treponema zioleckii TaxID=331680 RepID=UPI00168B3BAF|nr:ImmA/IrrE family metallo-endopeptidase [Treponema zioleckii]
MRLSDERYEEIKEEVVELYKELHITKFPVNAMDVCKQLGIAYKSYNQFTSRTFAAIIRASEDGMVAKIDKKFVIFYNPSKSAERIRSTFFHEIGHIRLGHKIHDEENEAEANFFASYFLVPVPLIHYFGLRFAQEIMDKFWVTFTLANYSLDRYQKRIRYSGTVFTQYENDLISLAKEEEKEF